MDLINEMMVQDAYKKGLDNASQLADIANQEYKVYGTFWNKGSSPTLTRIDDAIGATANAGVDTTPAFNQFDMTAIFKDFAEVTDSYGNVFIRIPKMYIRKVDLAGYRTRQVSRFKWHANAYLPWCFWDFTNGKELDYIDVGKYDASLSDDGLRLESKTGKYPLVNKNIVEFRNYAKANGAGYQQLDIHVWDLLYTLFTIEFATINSQSIVGGYTAGQWATDHLAVIAETATNRIVIVNAKAAGYEAGQAIGIGTSQGGNQVASNRTITGITDYDASNKSITFDGAPVNIAIGNLLYNTGYKSGACDNVSASVGSKLSNSTAKHPFKWHGIENLFGNVWQFVDGVNINELQAWVCKNAANYASNLFASPYQQLGYVNGATEGYITTMGFDTNFPFAEFAIAAGGSASTYYCDYYFGQTGQRVARVGGSWYGGSVAGVSGCSLSDTSSSAHVSCGGRLIRKPA